MQRLNMTMYSGNDIQRIITQLELECASLSVDVQSGFKLAVDRFKKEAELIKISSGRILIGTESGPMVTNCGTYGYFVTSGDIAEAIFDLGPKISKIAVKSNDEDILEICGHTSGLLLNMSGALSDSDSAAKELINTTAFISKKQSEIKISGFTWQFGVCGFDVEG